MSASASNPRARRGVTCVLVAVPLAIAVLTILLAHSAHAAPVTYYVSPTGNDRAPGTSTRRPWRTLARVNRVRLRPGDRVLLRGGTFFGGTLRLGHSDGGSAARPVVISSFGTGRATILAGGAPAIELHDLGGVRISNLTLVGSGATSNRGSGVQAVNDLRGAASLRMLDIEGVQASGFGFAGISLAGKPADGSQSGYRDVTINNCVAHDNRYYGVYVDGVEDARTTRYANSGVKIENCRAYDNQGDPSFTRSHSGSGIFLADVNGGRIDHSVAYGNGALNACGDCGPVGIWAANANAVSIEHSESYENHSGPSGHDGDGFDLDGGTTNCVLQYDYSHDNDGTGFLLYDYAGAPHRVRGNTIRFNLSRDDSRRGGYPALLVGNDGGEVEDSQVYNNSVLLSPPVGGSPSALEAFGTVNAQFRDNLLATTGGLPVVEAPGSQAGLSFQGNNYWSGDQDLSIAYAGVNYASLPAWQAATGQERVGGKDVGTSVAPEASTVGAPASVTARG
jgi:hypothetical protein